MFFNLTTLRGPPTAISLPVVEIGNDRVRLPVGRKSLGRLSDIRRPTASVTALLAADGDRRETIQGGGPFHPAVKTGTELAAEAEQSLVEIDAEIARVAKEIKRLLQDAKV